MSWHISTWCKVTETSTDGFYLPLVDFSRYTRRGYSNFNIFSWWHQFCNVPTRGYPYSDTWRYQHAPVAAVLPYPSSISSLLEFTHGSSVSRREDQARHIVGPWPVKLVRREHCWSVQSCTLHAKLWSCGLAVRIMRWGESTSANLQGVKTRKRTRTQQVQD
jgi:hypothetical protein